MSKGIIRDSIAEDTVRCRREISFPSFKVGTRQRRSRSHSVEASSISTHLPSTRPYTRNSYRLYARFRVLAPLPGRYLCFRHELFERVRVQEAEAQRVYSRFPVGSVGLA